MVIAIAAEAEEAAKVQENGESRLKRDSSGGFAISGVSGSALVAASPRGTPFYAYDVDAMAGELGELTSAFGDRKHLVAFAVKANSAGPIVSAFARAGAGADVVSGTELELALRAGVSPNAIVYSGVAKLDHEIDVALTAGGGGILALQVESVEELPRIEARARALGVRARVSIRVNPDIEADTHAHIATGHDEAKFGVPVEDVGDALAIIFESSRLELVGVGNHIGSQLTSTEGYCDAARKIVALFGELDRALAARSRDRLRQIDFGGGFGIDYGSGCAVKPRDFAQRLVDMTRASISSDVTIVVEPGRSLVASHGYLIASVVMEKRTRNREPARRWTMIDAGMNDLMRPALYAALHRIEPLEFPPSAGVPTRVVGPVCESSDDFGLHTFGETTPKHVIIRDAGAYGFTMASQYNGRALPAELFVERGEIAIILAPAAASEWVSSRFETR